MAAVTQLNVIPFLADLAVMLNKAEAVEIIIPLFVESLEEGDASVPSLVRLRVGQSSFLLYLRLYVLSGVL